MHALQVYCLPDNYEVVDRSLDDVRHVLDPRFTPADVAKLDKVGRRRGGKGYREGGRRRDEDRSGALAPLRLPLLVDKWGGQAVRYGWQKILPPTGISAERSAEHHL